MRAKELIKLLSLLEGNPEILIEHDHIVTKEKVLEPVCVSKIVVKGYKQGIEQKYHLVKDSPKFTKDMVETIKLF